MPNLAKFAYQALRDIGCLRPGQTTSADVIADILDVANEMIDGWQLDELMMFTSSIAAYPLIGGKQNYTIGPVGTDLVAPRPTRIEYANLILNTVNPVVRRPIVLITDQQKMNIRVQDIQFALPLELYYDGGFDPTSGFGNIFLWPGPQSNYGLELMTWQQLQSFTDATTNYNFPPGYALAIRKNLAVQIAPMMEIYSKLATLAQPRQSLLQLITQQAREALDVIRSYNAPDPLLSCDPAFMGGRSGGFNYMIGESR